MSCAILQQGGVQRHHRRTLGCKRLGFGGAPARDGAHVALQGKFTAHFFAAGAFLALEAFLAGLAAALAAMVLVKVEGEELKVEGCSACYANKFSPKTYN